MIWVADGKTNSVYPIAVGDFGAPVEDLVDGENAHRLEFVVNDMATDDGVLWVATEVGVFEIAPGADAPLLILDEPVSALTPVDESIRADGGLALASGNEIRNMIRVGAGLQAQLSAPGSRARRLAAFVALE